MQDSGSPGAELNTSGVWLTVSGTLYPICVYEVHVWACLVDLTLCGGAVLFLEWKKYKKIFLIRLYLFFVIQKFLVPDSGNLKKKKKEPQRFCLCNVILFTVYICSCNAGIPKLFCQLNPFDLKYLIDVLLRF